MSGQKKLLNDRRQRGLDYIDGARRAIVADIKDPLGEGRVKIRLPDEKGDGTWAHVTTLMAGNNRGSWFIPEVDDEVLVVFEGGDPRSPYVVGGLWTATKMPPVSMDGAGSNNLKVLRSRNGLQVTLDDAEGQEKLMLETPGGQKVTMRDGPGTIELSDGHGNSVKLEMSGITISTSATVKVNAGAVELTAGALIINAGLSKFSGTIQADTVICNSVISASYSPGAGNVW